MTSTVSAGHMGTLVLLTLAKVITRRPWRPTDTNWSLQWSVRRLKLQHRHLQGKPTLKHAAVPHVTKIGHSPNPQYHHGLSKFSIHCYKCHQFLQYFILYKPWIFHLKYVQNDSIHSSSKISMFITTPQNYFYFTKLELLPFISNQLIK